MIDELKSLPKGCPHDDEQDADETAKQNKCPYCHGKEELDAGFHANAVIGKDESGNPSICVETLEQKFYIPIKLCPMCGMKLEAFK